MVNTIIQLIVVLLVCGFLYWAFQLLMSVATFIAEPFRSVINVLVLVLVGAILLFYAIIPLLQQLGHMNFGIR